MVETLRISVLGSPILQFGERPLTADLISLKGQALLVYLAVTRRAHSRTSLAGLLWGDLPEESARANLRLTLSKLRKILPETNLLTTRLDVALADFWLDAAEFENRLEIGDWTNLQSPISSPPLLCTEATSSPASTCPTRPNLRPGPWACGSGCGKRPLPTFTNW